jgi:hypothetical protein
MVSLIDSVRYNQDGSTGDGYDAHVMDWFIFNH